MFSVHCILYLQCTIMYVHMHPCCSHFAGYVANLSLSAKKRMYNDKLRVYSQQCGLEMTGDVKTGGGCPQVEPTLELPHVQYRMTT